MARGKSWFEGCCFSSFQRENLPKYSNWLPTSLARVYVYLCAVLCMNSISLSEIEPIGQEKHLVETSEGRKGESKEERKERKAKIKQEQRVISWVFAFVFDSSAPPVATLSHISQPHSQERRQRKKVTKDAYKMEEQQQLRRLAAASSTQEHMAVHRYA